MEVGTTLGVIAIRAGINTMEIVDFILGCFGLDIAKDDPKKEKKPTTGRTEPGVGLMKMNKKKTGI